MQHPPMGVKIVMEAVCIIKDVRIAGDKPGVKIDDYWDVGKALLVDPAKFLDGLCITVTISRNRSSLKSCLILTTRTLHQPPSLRCLELARPSVSGLGPCTSFTLCLRLWLQKE